MIRNIRSRMIPSLYVDLNGTITDDEHVHEAILRHLMSDLWGLELTPEEYAKYFQGTPSAIEVVRRFTADKYNGIQLADDQIMELISIGNELYGICLNQGSVKLREGFIDFFERFKEWQPASRTALVTSESRTNVENLKAVLGIPDFDVIVSIDDVSKPKPNKQPYTRAGNLLGTSPEYGIALEDSVIGVTSSSYAGCLTLGIYDGKNELLARALMNAGAKIVTTFEDLTIEMLGELYGTHIDSLDAGRSLKRDFSKPF